MASPTYPNGLIPGTPQLTISAGADIPQGTYLGFEATVAFAAAAAVSSGDDGTLIHGWTVKAVPDGSSVATGDITSPTNLTGATLAAWDEAGWYTLRLTTTRASDGVVAVSDRHIYVGLPGDWFVHRRLDLTADANQPIPANGAYTVGGVSFDFVSDDWTKVVVAVVNGAGLRFTNAGVHFTSFSKALSALMPGLNRVRSYAAFLDASISSMDTNLEQLIVDQAIAARSATYSGIFVDYNGAGRLGILYSGSSATTAQAVPATCTIGLIGRAQCLLACENIPGGNLGSSFAPAAATAISLGPEGWPIKSEAPAATQTFDQTTDLFEVRVKSTGAGGNAVFTIPTMLFASKR